MRERRGIPVGTKPAATAAVLLWLALWSVASPAQETTSQQPSPNESPPTTASNDPLPAQDPPEEPKKDDGRARLEKVVVTANKREQLLTDVPMSISTISGKDLEKNGEHTFAEYAQKIPALNFGYYGEGRQRISLRGLQAPSGVSTVAYIVDGIEQGDSPPDPELFDMDHIEVLRGPQGTLYGAGAVGGAIKLLTNRANPYAFQTKFLGSGGYNIAGAMEYDVNSMVNVPLITGELGARVVAFKRHEDGFLTIREPNWNNPPPFKSFNSDNVVATDANTTNVVGGRIALDWKASNDLSLGAKYMTETSKIRWGPAEDLDYEDRYGGYQMVQGCACAISGDITDHSYRLATFNLSYKLPFAQFESVTGAADVKEDLRAPLFIVLPLIDTGFAVVGQQPPPLLTPPPQLSQALMGLGLPGDAAIGDMFEFRLINQWSYVSQEFRLVSAPSDFPLTWTAGLFYKLENREAFEDVFAGPVLGPALNSDGGSGPYDQVNLHFHTEEYAAYGQLEYAITQKLSALAGVRYYRATLMDTALGGGTDGSIFRPRFHDLSPKFTLSYHITDSVLTYATAAKGFRIGGINFSTIDPPPPDLKRTYDPDVLWNYEVGMNSVLFDGTLQTNFAVWDCVWSNLQDEIILTSNPTVDANGFHAGGRERNVINAGKATSKGVEADITALLPLDLTWTINGAYIDARIGDQTSLGQGAAIQTGTPLENVPHVAGSTSLSHELRLGSGMGLSSSVTMTYRGKAHSDITNPTESRSPAYRVLDARVGVHGAAQKWSVDLFGKNLLNTRASSFTFQNSGTRNTLPFNIAVPLAYRTIGLRLNFNF